MTTLDDEFLELATSDQAAVNTDKSVNPGATLPVPKLNVEVGVSLNLPFGSSYQNSWEVYRDEEVTVKQLIQMRKTDGQARALYRLITLPIRAALKKATFKAADNEDGGDEEAQFIEQMLTLPTSSGGMVTPLSKVVSQILMAVFDGFAGFELVYWSPLLGPLEGKWTLKKIAWRPAETLTFLLDDNGNYDGFRQRASFKGHMIDVKIPGEHSFYFACNEEEKPFYGQSYFQAAFYHWDKKVKLYYIAHLAAQRSAVGTRIGKMPANPSPKEKADFIAALANMGTAQYIAVPMGYEVESIKEGGTYDFLGMINHHSSQMSKSILASFFDDDQGGGQADSAIIDYGKQSDQMFLLELSTIMDDVATIINTKITPRFIDWNFGSGKYPEFVWGPLTEKEKQAIRETFDKLSVAGQTLTISEEFVHELEKVMADEFGLEIDYETIEAQMATDKEMARLQQEQLFGSGAPAGFDPTGGAGGAGGSGGPPGGGGAPQAGPNVPPNLLPKGFS